MNILGIDTGAVNVGFGVLSSKVSVDRSPLVDYGLWGSRSEFKKINDKSIDSLRQLYPLVREKVEEWDITHILIETVPIKTMGQRDRVVATANLFRVLAIEFGLHYAEIAPVSVKKRATGNAKATKEMMKEKVLELYPETDDTLRPDVYDAILIAEVANTLKENEWWKPVSINAVQ